MWTQSIGPRTGRVAYNRQSSKGLQQPSSLRELSIKIKGETLTDQEVGTTLVQIVKDSFRRGFEYEIT